MVCLKIERKQGMYISGAEIIRGEAHVLSTILVFQRASNILMKFNFTKLFNDVNGQVSSQSTIFYTTFFFPQVKHSSFGDRVQIPMPVLLAASL